VAFYLYLLPHSSLKVFFAGSKLKAPRTAPGLPLNSWSVMPLPRDLPACFLFFRPFSLWPFASISELFIVLTPLLMYSSSIEALPLRTVARDVSVWTRPQLFILSCCTPQFHTGISGPPGLLGCSFSPRFHARRTLEFLTNGPPFRIHEASVSLFSPSEI